ncbi:hypothetical protein [Lelliottia amnigena]|uniref:hypothetical protein n=1 Tax=Lelliottia amnigena TaxID=61646 RepID=UPI0034641FD8
MVKFAKRAAEDGWEVRAALPTENGGQLDWNDLLQRDKLTPNDWKQYRHHGRLLLADSPSAKALLIYQHTERTSFHFNLWISHLLVSA